jgi:hypothetical protein
MRRIRSHMTYANVMATIAVFFVLSGGTAVALSGTDTVQSDDLGPGSQVKGPDVAANAVNGSDVVDNSIASADIQNFSLGNGDLLTGSVDSRAAADSSLTSADIQNFSLGNGDLLTGSVDSRAAADSSLTGADVSLNSLTGNDINESTLVGVKDGNSCISGAALYGRLCAGSDGVNRTLFAAFNFCASIDLRLPTWGEAVLLAVNHDVPGVGASPARFWTDEITLVQAPRFGVMTVEENGAGDPRFDNATFETVCVTTPD